MWPFKKRIPPYVPSPRENALERVDYTVGILTCASPFLFDIRGPGIDPTILVQEWSEYPAPGEIDALFALLDDPVELAAEDDQYNWDDALANLLGAWIANDPPNRADRLVQRLGSEKPVKITILTMGLAVEPYGRRRSNAAKAAACFAGHLQSMLNLVPHLEEEEIMAMAEVFSARRNPIDWIALEEIVRLAPEKFTDLHRDVNCWLDNRVE